MRIQIDVGAVVIGRNEGDRLIKCLKSVLNSVKKVIYVDSGSTDDSQNAALKLGVEVVELDLPVSFTAARARNAGFEMLLRCYPEVKYVQFIDGDCQIVAGWIARARFTLEHNSAFAVVCGRRRENYPEHSIYNLLCDMEWDTPVGETKACGGDFMIRTSVFKEVNGFNPAMIAGEEPELCLRIRIIGWKIIRLKDEMTKHDANITKFSQWWKRNVRGGHAFSEAAYMHSNEPDQDWVKSSVKIWAWAAFIPIGIIILSVFNPKFWLLLVIYPLQTIRIAMKTNVFEKESWFYAFFVMLGKFPELQGQIRFFYNKIMQSKSSLIEYK